MSVDSSGNQKVDFAWGNFPLQPNDDREGTGASVVVEPASAPQNHQWSGTVVYPSAQLNQALDNHLLVSTGHNGYPEYLPNDIDNIPGDIPIPDLVGGTVSFATAQWANAGFNAANITINYIPNAEGANPQNNGVIASQEPAAGHTADANHGITLNVYQYIVPEIVVAIFNPTYGEADVGGRYAMGPNDDFILFNPFRWDIGALGSYFLSSSPSPANNGWAGLYFRCEGVSTSTGETIANGDYRIANSGVQSGTNPYFTIQMPHSQLSGGANFYLARLSSGFVTIIQKF
jgi:hypothetical protein